LSNVCVFVQTQFLDEYGWRLTKNLVKAATEVSRGTVYSQRLERVNWSNDIQRLDIIVDQHPDAYWPGNSHLAFSIRPEAREMRLKLT